MPLTDRDSERWGLPPKMVQRRRQVFWDVFVADVWTVSGRTECTILIIKQSLNTGRPPSFSLAYTDCNYPQYDEQKSKDGEVACRFFQCSPPLILSSVEVWQFRFAAECVADVTARTLTAEAPTYAIIMELDQKVREFPLPDDTRDKNDMAASFRRFVLEHIRETGIPSSIFWVL